MSASRIRVRQPVSFAGLVLLLAWAGLVWGMVGGSIFRLLQSTFSLFIIDIFGRGWGVLVVDTLGKGWSVLGMVLVLVWMPLLSQRYWRTFLAGGAASGAYVIGHGFAWKIMLSGVVEWTWLSWVEQFVRIAFTGVVHGLLAMLAVLICRTFLFTLVSQDGSLCNRCGYAVGKTDAMICAECGSERDTKMIAPRGGRLANWLGARSRRATVALGTLIAVLALWLTWLQWPYMQFREQFHASPAWRYTGTNQRDFPIYSISAAQPVQDSLEDAWLIVDLGRNSPFSAVQMRVRIGADWSQPPHQYVNDGTPRIICELRGEQMRSVLRDGVSQELIDRLVEAAREQEWSPDRQTHYWEMPNNTIWVQPP